MVLSIVSLGATAFVPLTHREWAAAFSYSCIIVLIAYFSVAIRGYVLHGAAVTMDKMFAAICVYLLIGLLWTFGYALVDGLQTGAFTITGERGPEPLIARLRDLRYFSFMTLTTVGYGDIVPHSTTARTLAALEVVAGQIYLAVLVARLVGLHIVYAVSSRQE